MENVKRLIGSWHLRNWSVRTVRHPEFRHPFGENPLGLLIYSEDGWMSAAISARERPRFSPGGNPRTAAPDEITRAYASYFHYAGSYRIEGAVVIHSVTQSLNPDFPGTEQRRAMEFRDALLILRGEEAVDGDLRHHELTWARH